MRDRERDLHLQQIAEGAQAGVEQDVADLGDHFARRGIDRQRQRRLAGQQFLQDRRARLVEDEQRVAAHRAGEDLMHAGDRAGNGSLERIADVVDRVQRDLRHVEQDTVAGELRQRRGGPAEADVEQLDEGVLLGGCELHYVFAPSTSAITFKIAARSTGLVTKPLAPPLSAISRDESWISEDTTTTRAPPSSSLSLVSTSRPFMPCITRSSSTRSGFSRKYRSSALIPSSASTTL